MYNFCHVPCEPDGPDSNFISNQIREKTKIIENKMKFFLKMKFGTRFFNLKTFNDVKNEFPRLTLQEIRKYITFGSYQIRLSRSYIGEIIENNKISRNLKITRPNQTQRSQEGVPRRERKQPRHV